MSIIEPHAVVIDRVCSDYLKPFIDDYALDMEIGQNSFFKIYLTDFLKYCMDYPQHQMALERFYEELSDSGATFCVILYWR